MKKITIISMSMLLSSALYAQNIESGEWNITLNNDKTLNYSHSGKVIFKNASSTFVTTTGETIETKDYPTVKLTETTINDGFGQGTRYTYTFSGLSGKDNMEQNFYFYPTLPYFLVESTVVSSNGTTSTNKICPIVTRSSATLPLPSSNNRIYTMPFANDNWATFNTTPWSTGVPITTCEATALFNVDNRNSFVIGSVDHSTWKTGISITPNGQNRLRSITIEAGYVSAATWDVFTDGKASSTSHGSVRGARVSSPKYMIGWFEDWRVGMETYGEANTVLCPKYEWTKDESLFGWQSWGGMEWGLNYNSAMSLLDFFEKELKPVGFQNKNGRCLIVLDSGWDALNDAQLRSFAERCKELGFVAGIYATPFSYWGGEDQIKNNDYWKQSNLPEWQGGYLGEMVLKAGGKYRKINGFSLDPTHPAVKDYNRVTFKKFRELGFEFVKIDFMNNGSQEADKWYDPNITTGLQAYNYGMDYIKEFAGDDIMLDFSIAPVFPAKAHVRRIGCDAWGDLPQSMYTLNCINGSWWLDRVYAFNDPDHMCLSKVSFSGKGSNDENEARIRYTCGLITGMTLLGGTYAYEGDTKNINGKPVHVVGYDAERERAVKFANNKDLTEMCQIGRSFRPVEGTFSNFASLFNKDDVSVDNEFILNTPTAFYYVVFNYDKASPLTKEVDYKRLGITAEEFVNVKELWEGKNYNSPNLEITVPAKDVRIYRFERKEFAGMENVATDRQGSVAVSVTGSRVSVSSTKTISTITILGVDGKVINNLRVNSTKAIFTTSQGIKLISVCLETGETHTDKVVIR